MTDFICNASNIATTDTGVYVLVTVYNAGKNERRKGMTMFEAIKTMVDQTDDERGDSICHVRHRHDDRAVAFWSAWTHTVRPMAAATDYERAQMRQDWPATVVSTSPAYARGER